MKAILMFYNNIFLNLRSKFLHFFNKSREEYIKFIDLSKTKKELSLENEIKNLKETVKLIQKDKGLLFFDSEIKELIYPTFTHSYILTQFIRNIFKYKKQRNAFLHEYSRYKSSLKKDNATKINSKLETLEEGKRFLKLNDTYKRIFYLADLPNPTDYGALVRILNAPFPMDISMFIKSTSTSAMIKASRDTRNILEAEVENRERKSKSIPKDLELQIQQAEEFEDKIARGEEKGFLVSIYIAIEAESEKELIERSREFINLVEESRFTFNPYSFGQLDSYKSILPFTEDKIKKDYVMQTSLVSYLMPFLSRNINDPDGIFLGKSMMNGQLIFFDLFKARNANINIFGTSGSGKSYTARLIANRLALRETQIIILDPEGEYYKLQELIGGQVIRFDRDHGINPFYINTTDKNEINDHIQLLKAFFKFFIREGHYDQAELDQALVKLYASEKPTFESLLSLLKDSKMYKDLEVLESGSLAGLFNSKEEIDLTNRIIIFDLYDLKSEEMKRPAMFLLASIISKLIKKKDQKRMLVIDEAHLFLKDKFTANFYMTLVKTARKYNAGIISVTQNVEDYYEDEFKVGQSILTNAETNILLKQSFASVKYLKNTYLLSASEMDRLTSFKIGEALLTREKEHVHVDIIPFRTEEILDPRFI